MTSSEPRAMVPSPASLFSQLRGRRVIVGVPGVGFRADLRADDPVTNAGRTFVPVLTEQDYYRAEIEQIEVFAPLVPLDRVWVEDLVDGPTLRVQPMGALDAPAPRRAVAATSLATVFGARVIQAVPDGHVRDLRAVTGVYVGQAGLAVRVTGEAEWYRWALAGTTPPTIEVPAEDLWCE